MIPISRIKRAAKKAGGKVVPDGCGGYDLLAPDGCRWLWSEVWCQPIPLGEATNAEDKADMMQWALDCATGGIEWIEE